MFRSGARNGDKEKQIKNGLEKKKQEEFLTPLGRPFSKQAEEAPNFIREEAGTYLWAETGLEKKKRGSTWQGKKEMAQSR